MTKYRIKRYHNPNTGFTWYIIQKRWLGIFWTTKKNSGMWELFPGNFYSFSNTLEEAVEEIRKITDEDEGLKEISSEVVLEYDKYGRGLVVGP